MTKLGSLSFELQFNSAELQSLTLPVEVRKPNMALVARTLSSESVDVPPGNYFVTAQLPAGQSLSKFIKIDEGTNEKVTLAPENEDQSPHESHEVRHFFIEQQVLKSPSGLESLGPELEVKLRCFTGNLLQSEDMEEVIVPWAPPMAPADTGTLEIRMYGLDRPMIAQLLQESRTPINIALPVASATYCTIVLTRQPDGGCTFDVQLEHHMAELLLRYCEKGLFEFAQQLTDPSGANTDPALNAKQLLYDKKSDPVAACVGAYTLLRFGKLEYLHDWTNNLKNLFPWLPDGVAIRGEHLARLGKHDEAIDTFLELSSRGLPIFSDGITYVQDRLRYYNTLGDKEFDPDKLARARDLLGNLQKFIPYIDFGKSILSYSGLHPKFPDNETIEFVPPGSGLDVNSFLP